MASNLLTDKTIRAGLKKAAEGASHTLTDGDGLTLIARPDNVGWWRLRYWLDGRENRLSLGVYPTVTLAEARMRRDEARKLVASGVDPSEHRKAAKKARQARQAVEKAIANGGHLPGSFEAVALEWLEKVHEPKVSAVHAERTRTRFKNDIFPWLGRRPLSEIEAPELLAVLRRIEARGAIETTHRAKNACGQVFRYGVAVGYCTRNPAADLSEALTPMPAETHFAAITEPRLVGQLMRDIEGYQGHPLTKAALQLSALLFQRPGNIRAMEWSWVDFCEAVLVIPAASMKRDKKGKVNGDPHLVPLAPQAMAILRDEVWPLTGGGRYVFPGQLTSARCLSENTLRTALRRLGYSNEEMTPHGFRAIARTLIAERLELSPEVVEAQLAHAVKSANGRAYNRTQFLEQRRRMMTTWADYLDQLRQGAEIVPLRPAA